MLMHSNFYRPSYTFVPGSVRPIILSLFASGHMFAPICYFCAKLRHVLWLWLWLGLLL